VKTFRVGIAGYGVVGPRRREHIDKHPRMRTVAVCDQKFKDASSLEGGLRRHRHYTELLEEDLDVLFDNKHSAAAALGALFEGMAKLLTTQQRP